MERDQQRLARPAALRTPRSIEHGFVNHGAQRIARRQHILCRNFGAARALLERPDLLNRLSAQALDIGLRNLAAQASSQHQQGDGGLNQWIDRCPREVRNRPSVMRWRLARGPASRLLRSSLVAGLLYIPLWLRPRRRSDIEA